MNNLSSRHLSMNMGRGAKAPKGSGDSAKESLEAYVRNLRMDMEYKGCTKCWYKCLGLVVSIDEEEKTQMKTARGCLLLTLKKFVTAIVELSPCIVLIIIVVL